MAKSRVVSIRLDEGMVKYLDSLKKEEPFCFMDSNYSEILRFVLLNDMKARKGNEYFEDYLSVER